MSIATITFGPSLFVPSQCDHRLELIADHDCGVTVEFDRLWGVSSSVPARGVTVCPKTLCMTVLIREAWTRAMLWRYALFRNSRGGGSSVCTPCVLSSLTGPDMWGVLDGQRRPLAAWGMVFPCGRRCPSRVGWTPSALWTQPPCTYHLCAPPSLWRGRLSGGSCLGEPEVGVSGPELAEYIF
jgi:hypothetical protein